MIENINNLLSYFANIGYYEFVSNNPIFLFFRNNISFIYAFFLICLIVLLCSHFNYLKALFRQISRPTWIFLILILFLSFYVRIGNYETAHRSESLAGDYLKNSIHIYEGEVPSISDHPQFYGFMLSNVSFLFNLNLTFVSWYNALIGTITVLIVFLLSYQLFKNETGALFSGLVFSLSKLNLSLTFQNSDSVQHLLFLPLTLLFLFMALEKINIKSLMLFFISFVIFLNIRPNLILLIPVVVLTLILYHKRIKLYKIKTIVLIFILFLIATIPLQYTLFSSLNINKHHRENDAIQKNFEGIKDIIFKRNVPHEGNLFESSLYLFILLSFIF